MNLHRAESQGEWKSVPPEEWNAHQVIAELSGGVATLANVLTVAGGAMVFDGIRDLEKDEHMQGILKICVGRTMDIADGYVANRFSVKGPVGEAADAGMDSILTLYTAYKLQRIGVLPTEFALALGAQQGLNMALTGLAKNRGKEIHTGASGKISHGMKWAAISMYSASYMSDNIDGYALAHKLHFDEGMEELAQKVEQINFKELAENARSAANAIAVGSLTLGSVATVSYGRQALA